MALNETYQDNSEQFGNYVRAMLNNIEPDAAAADVAFVLFKKELKKKRRRRIIFWFFLLLTVLMLLLTGVLLISNKKQQINTTPEINNGTNHNQMPPNINNTTQSTNTIEGEPNQSDNSKVLKGASGNLTTKGSDFKKTTTVITAPSDSSDVSNKYIKIAGPDMKPLQNSPDSVLKIDLNKTDNIKKTKPDSAKKAKSDTVYIIW